MKEHFIRLGNLLDRVSREKIIFLGLGIILLLAIGIHMVMTISLDHKIKGAQEEGYLLEQEIRLLEAAQAERSGSVLEGRALPQALSDVQMYFTSKNLDVEEILIQQISPETNGSLSQVLIKLSVQGERSRILSSLRGYVANSSYSLVVGEIDFYEDSAVIQLLIPVENLT